MDSKNSLDTHNLQYIKTERIEELDLPTEFEGLADKPSKCGDIFTFNEGRYLFCCSFCEKNFEEIENFIKHVEEDHLKLVEDSTAMPQTKKSSPDLEEPIDTKVKVEYIDIPIEPELVEHDSKSKKSETKEKTETKAENIKKNPTLTCEVCGKKYYTDSGLRRHREKLHSEQPYPKIGPKEIFKCTYCDRTFKYKAPFVAHERTHTGESPFQCPICLKCFPGPWQYRQHQVTHTGERPHKCPHCPSAFSNRSNLLTHIRIHLGEKRHKCDQCEKCFVTSTELKTHIRSHTGERPYQCEQCGVKLKTASALLFHKKQDHLKLKHLACQICGKRFLTGTFLRNHMAVHSNERPFECSICSATFPRRKTLISHLKIHSDVKEYVCKICGKDFAQGPGLYSHMKSHGINKTFKEPSETLNSDSCK